MQPLTIFIRKAHKTQTPATLRALERIKHIIRVHPEVLKAFVKDKSK